MDGFGLVVLYQLCKKKLHVSLDSRRLFMAADDNFAGIHADMLQCKGPVYIRELFAKHHVFQSLLLTAEARE